jgi:hypothetical protein
VPLDVLTLALTPGQTSFAFTVPGHQIWRPRSVFARAQRVTGGTPSRAYSLNIANGDTVLAIVGADDNGAEPGFCDITWANTPAASIGVGALGVTVAPLGPLSLPAGYVITANIEFAAAGDQWVDAVCWLDYDYSA